MNVLEVRLNSAGYEDKPGVLHDIAFTVAPGQLVGLIGPNGAGKSTTIKAVLGLLKEVKGEVHFEGDGARFAYVPERPVFYDDCTLWEHLELAAAFAGDTEWRNRAEDLLRKFRLTDSRHLYPGGFSKGMQQKMMLLIAFLVRPAVYIIDEPFIGLDPRAVKDFLQLLRDELDRGASVLMSTHVLDTAEKLCDSFVLIDQGTLVAAGRLTDIRQASGLPDGSLFDCFDRLSGGEPDA